MEKQPQQEKEGKRGKHIKKKKEAMLALPRPAEDTIKIKWTIDITDHLKITRYSRGRKLKMPHHSSN